MSKFFEPKEIEKLTNTNVGSDQYHMDCDPDDDCWPTDGSNCNPDYDSDSLSEFKPV